MSSQTPDAPADRVNDGKRAMLRRFALAVLIDVAVFTVLAGIAGVVALRYLEMAKADWTRLDMKALETAYKSAMSMNGNKPPKYPEDIIPLLEQGANGLIDPWGGQYQMRLIQTPDGPRPQFFTFTPSGEEIVWPRK